MQVSQQSLFICRSCGSHAFYLALHPEFQGEVRVSTNDVGEVIIRVILPNQPEQEFIADLLFMNQFSVCAQCESLHQWGYTVVSP